MPPRCPCGHPGQHTARPPCPLLPSRPHFSTSITRAAREEPHSCRILTLVLAATVRCSRGSRVRLNDGLSHTKEIPTSPERPTHSFHALCAAPPGARLTNWKHPPRHHWESDAARSDEVCAFASSSLP